MRLYQPKLAIDESIRFISLKHHYFLIKQGRKISLDHPEGDERIIIGSGNLDDEKSMNRLKKLYNRQISKHEKEDVDYRRGLPDSIIDEVYEPSDKELDLYKQYDKPRGPVPFIDVRQYV